MKKPVISQILATVSMVAVISARAAMPVLPMPPPSGYVDTECSTNVPFGNWSGLRHRFTLILNAESSPTSCVQVALGRDANLDGDFAPEETDVIVGRDCGAWFVRDERSEVEKIGGGGQRSLNPNHLCPPPPSTSTSGSFALVLPKESADRWNLAKVIVRGTVETTPIVRVKYGYDGIIYFFRRTPKRVKRDESIRDFRYGLKRV